MVWRLDDPGAYPFITRKADTNNMHKLAILDFESTGLDTRLDEPIELFIQIWTTDHGLLPGAENCFYRLILPQGEAHPRAAEVNGYSRQGWIDRGARPLCTDDMYELNKFLVGHAPDFWCGHNAAKFDVPMLETTYERVRAKQHKWKGDHRIIDTQALAAPLLFTGEIKGVGLEHLLTHFGITNHAPHTSPGDVVATAALLERLCGRYLGARAAE